MALTQNAKVAEFGIAKQSSEGSAVANPTYAMPVFEGLPRPVQNVEPIQVTDTAVTTPLVWKTDAHWEAQVTVPGFADSVGNLIKSVLPTDTKTGAGDPYTHAFTAAGTDSFFTLFSRRPGDLYEQFVDGVGSELAVTFNETEPVKVQGTFMGKTISVLGSAYTAGTTNAMSNTTEWLTPIGATLKLDVAATPATTTVTNITSGTVTVRRSVELLQAVETITPNFVHKGPYEVGVALDLVFDNYNLYRATFYGATGGSALSSTIVEGSINFKFLMHGNATHYLEILVPKVALLVPEAPQPDAAGGPYRVSVDGIGLRPTAGSIITMNLLNAVATAY